MNFDLHEGGLRMKPADRVFTPPLLTGSEVLCETCASYNAHFMWSAAQATQYAAQKPDDQIWLAVFESLQQMLAHRTSCSNTASERLRR